MLKIKEEMRQLEETVLLQQQQINKLPFPLSNLRLHKVKNLDNVVAYSLQRVLLPTCRQKRNLTYLFTRLISARVKFTNDQIFHLTRVPNFNNPKYSILLSSSKFICNLRNSLNSRLVKSRELLLKQQLNY